MYGDEQRSSLKQASRSPREPLQNLLRFTFVLCCVFVGYTFLVPVDAVDRCSCCLAPSAMCKAYNNHNNVVHISFRVALEIVGQNRFCCFKNVGGMSRDSV